MIIRIRPRVSVGIYDRDQFYDVDATEGIRHLVEAGLVDIIAFPPRGKVDADEQLHLEL